MKNNMNELLFHASVGLNQSTPVLSERVSLLAGNILDELLALLTKKNGFFAFESALHVFSSHACSSDIGLERWNDDMLWRNEYEDLVGECLFFAENIFGDQFCIKNNKIFIFDSETGSLEHLSNDLCGWARRVISDYNVLTGFPVAHEWQSVHGKIPPGCRLSPKKPFVTGGDYSTSNLFVCDSIEAMKYKGSVAVQIKSIPDGGQIMFDIDK